LSARVPISEIFNRKVRNDKILNQQRIEEFEKEAIEQTLREVIIKHYNVLKTKIKAISIKAKEIESLKLTANYAEQSMRKGDLDISGYTTALSILSRAEYELLNYHSDANLAYVLLQEIVGASPSKIDDPIQ
jgi:outer membrane protein TolC